MRSAPRPSAQLEMAGAGTDLLLADGGQEQPVTTPPTRYYNTDIAYSANAHWMTMFCIAALGRGRELGFPVDALLAWVAPHVIGQFGTPGYPPQLAGQYVVPDLKKAAAPALYGAAWFASWDEAFTGWSAQKQSGRLDGQIEIGYWGMGTNYYNEARTALSFVVDQPNGETAWVSCEDTIAAKTLESGIPIPWADDPTWSCVPLRYCGGSRPQADNP